jgi:hypothetical protein
MMELTVLQLWIGAILAFGLVFAALDTRATRTYRRRVERHRRATKLLQEVGTTAELLALPEDNALREWIDKHLSGSIRGQAFRPSRRGSRFLLREYPSELYAPPPRSPVSFAPAFLTAVGVLGTFYGIASGLRSLDRARIGEDTGQLMTSIWGLIEGMQTAFHTSLWGLGLAVFAMMFLALGARARTKIRQAARTDLNSIAELDTPLAALRQLASTDRSKLDELQRESAEALMEAATEMGAGVRKMGTVLEALDADLIGRRVGEALERSLQPTFEGMREELHAIQQRLVERNEDLIRGILGEMRVQVFEPVTRRLDQSAAITKSAADSVKALQAELGGAVATIERFQTETLQKLLGFSEGLQEILNKFRDETADVLGDVAESVKTAVQESVVGMTAQRAAFEVSANQASETFRGIREELEQALAARAKTEAEMLAETRDGVHQILSDAEKSFEQQSGALAAVGRESALLMDGAREQLMTALQGIDGALRQTCQAVEGQLEAFRISYQERLDAFFQQQNELLESTLGAQREGLASVVQSLSEVFVQEYDRRRELGLEVQSTLSEAARTVGLVRELAEAVGLTSSAKFSQLEGLARSVGGQVSRLERQYRELDSQFQTMVETGHAALREYAERTNQHSDLFFNQLDEAASKVVGVLASAAEYLVAAEHQRQLSQPPAPVEE